MRLFWRVVVNLGQRRWWQLCVVVLAPIDGLATLAFHTRVIKGPVIRGVADTVGLVWLLALLAFWVVAVVVYRRERAKLEL